MAIDVCLPARRCGPDAARRKGWIEQAPSARRPMRRYETRHRRRRAVFPAAPLAPAMARDWCIPYRTNAHWPCISFLGCYLIHALEGELEIVALLAIEDR